MNRMKADQKSKVGKRKQAALVDDESDIEVVKVSRSSTSDGRDSTRSRETTLRQFVSWTQSSEPIGFSYLQKSNWNIEYAMQLYFDNPNLFSGGPVSAPKPVVTFDKVKSERFFYNYVDKRDSVGKDRMGPNGISRLLQDLNYQPTDREALVLAWKFKAQTQCEFSLDEWHAGVQALNADNIQALKQRIDAANAEVSADRAKFRELYSFAFDYGKSASCRSLDLEIAICYWDVLFGTRSTLMSQWIDFLRLQEQIAQEKLHQDLGANAKNVKSVWITKDTWTLFWDFVVLSKPDLSDYDDEGAWPVLIDQFVEYCRDSLGYPKQKKENEMGEEENPHIY